MNGAATQEPILNSKVVIGLLVGPAIGAALYALLTLAGHGKGIDPWAVLLDYGQLGYLIALPVTLPLLLILRHLRRDSLAITLLTSFVFGVVLYVTILSPLDMRWGPIVFQGGLPVALAVGATRLIAGRGR